MPKIQDSIKRNFRLGYDIVRSAHHGAKESKARKIYEAENKVCHKKKVSINVEISKLFVEPSIKRINLIFESFTEKSISDNAGIIKIATKFAKEKSYVLRVISRNNLPNPKLFVDFARKNNLLLPDKYSFYTDSLDRVSSPTYRLEVTRDDIFFLENEADKLKEFIKNA